MKNTTTRTSNDIKNEILELLSIENIFNECIEELDNWNGFLDADRYYPMYDIDFILCEKTPTEILSEVTQDFNIKDEYFRFRIYGLESSNYIDYSICCKVEELYDYLEQNYYNLDLPDEIEELFSELKEMEELKEE